VHFHPAVFALLAATTTKKNGSPIGTFVLFGLIIVAGYFFFIRPQRNRQRKALETKQAIEPGVEVVTTAGLIAKVVEMDDETVVLEVAPGVHSRFLRQAIVRAVQEPPAEESIPADETTPEPEPTGEEPPAPTAS
jgi:preprotein translocase subunit YajC